MRKHHLESERAGSAAKLPRRRDRATAELMNAHEKPYWTSVLSESNHPVEVLSRYGIGRSAVPFSADYRTKRWL